MENVEELVNKICEKNNYDEILLELVKKGKDSKINKILEEISNNNKLKDSEKNNFYDKIFDYVKEVNESFENKVRDIYKKGYKEASETMLMLSSYSIISNSEKDEELENCLNDYIIKRLEQKNGLVNNLEYQKKVKKAKNENDSEKLKELYLVIKDLENIDSYKVGFYDAIKLLCKEEI